MRNSMYWHGVLLALITFGGAAVAEPHGGMGMHGDMMRSDKGHGMMMGGAHGGMDHFKSINSMHIFAALDLSDEQRKQVMELRRELRKNTWDLQRQIIDQREQLGMLYGGDGLDVAAIKSAYEKLFQVKLKIIEHALKFKQDLAKVLSAEQQQQLRQMMMHGKVGGSMKDEEESCLVRVQQQ